MRKGRGRKLQAAAAMVGGLLAVGCGKGAPVPTQPPSVQEKVSLLTFTGPSACASLEAYIEDNAVAEMKYQIESSREGGWAMGALDGRAGPKEAAPSAAGASAGPTAYTTTNTQVAGVDEADFVKNDGTRIFVLSGNTLYASRSWPASALSLQGKIQIEGWPQEMFLEENNRVVVFSSVYTALAANGTTPRTGAPCSPMSCGYYSSDAVKVTVLDVSDLSQPKVVEEAKIPGQYRSARRIGSSVRAVLADTFRFPEKLRWYPDAPMPDEDAKNRAYDAILVDNEALIRGQTLSDWLPASTVTGPDGVTVTLPVDCSTVHHTNAPTRLGLVTVATLNLDKPAQLRRTSVLAEAGEVYASTSALYLANNHWWWWPEPGQVDATYLHKFDITQPDDAVYLASGKVDGHIVDQFSLDEHQGHLRVASTIFTRVEEPNNRWGRIETTNRISVLDEQNGALEKVGQTADLAPGESLFSARFLGDKGFAVTFRQTDPLFTFDLSDPTAPRQVGELKVPGVSTYLHPLDDHHLLTIGNSAPQGGNGWMYRNLELAIFDVTDLAHPRQTFVQTVGTSYSGSEAEYDHHAFNYFPEKKLLAIPFYDWNSNATGGGYWSSFVSELRVFSVDAQTGFTPQGALSLADLFQTENNYGWSYYWSPMVRRSVLADNYVYAISDAGIRVAALGQLSSPLATVAFQRTSEP